MELIDTHAHLYDKAYDNKIDNIIANSKAQHVSTIYMPNIDLNTIKPMLAIANRYPSICKAMIGLHPCSVDANFKKKLNKIATWLPKHAFAAIGEIGIDLYHDKTYQKEQEEALHIQLNWASQYNLPIILHCRKSIDKVITIIKQTKNTKHKGIFHCFNGTPKQAQQIIEKGFYLGIGGIATFKGKPLNAVIETITLENIVLETDSPYLAPIPYRGKLNQPAYLQHIAQHIATIKKTTIEQVASITTHNTKSLFNTVK